MIVYGSTGAGRFYMVGVWGFWISSPDSDWDSTSSSGWGSKVRHLPNMQWFWLWSIDSDGNLMAPARVLRFRIRPKVADGVQWSSPSMYDHNTQLGTKLGTQCTITIFD